MKSHKNILTTSQQKLYTNFGIPKYEWSDYRVINGSLVHKTVEAGSYFNIGRKSIICRNTHIERDVIIGNKVIVGEGGKIGDYTEIGSGATICSNVKIGKGSWIKEYVTINDGAEIGNNVQIGSGASIGPNVIIESNIEIATGETIARSVLHHYYYIEGCWKIVDDVGHYYINGVPIIISEAGAGKIFIEGRGILTFEEIYHLRIVDNIDQFVFDFTKMIDKWQNMYPIDEKNTINKECKMTYKMVYCPYCKYYMGEYFEETNRIYRVGIDMKVKDGKIRCLNCGKEFNIVQTNKRG